MKEICLFMRLVLKDAILYIHLPAGHINLYRKDV